jgi:hypothetical protein
LQQQQNQNDTTRKLKKGSQDKGNGKGSCSNKKTKMMMTKSMKRKSQKEVNGGECCNNKKITTTTTKRMKRILEDKGDGKELAIIIRLG